MAFLKVQFLHPPFMRKIKVESNIAASKSADIGSFKETVADAPIKDVDVPYGRKEVEVAWEDSDGFHIEEGIAFGVYTEPGRRDPSVYHIDWEDGGRTTVQADSVVTFDESDYL